MTTTRTTIWRLSSPHTVSLRRYGGERVLYDQRSGDTHLLDEIAALVLDRLLTDEGSIQAITQYVRMRYPAGRAATPSNDEVGGALAKLAELGLVVDR